MAVLYNWTIKSNSDDVFSVVYSQDDVSETPIDITGYKARLWFKRDKSAFKADHKIESGLTINGSTITIEPTLGKLTIKLGYQTAQLMSGEYYYDLIITNTTGKICLLEGTLTVVKGVTE